MKTIQHPVPVGTKTNIGIIKSYKYVRYGFSKYRYFVKGTKKDFGEDEITKIYEKKIQRNNSREEKIRLDS
jgi:hypothetical protein